MDKLRQILSPLRVFDAVSRSGSVSKGADLLHVSPGAVSLQLQKLEDAVGVPLLRKEGRQLVKTAAGTDLAIRVADLFDRLESAVRDASRSEAPRGLRLKVMPSLAIKWLVPRLSGFYKLYGSVDIEISTVARPDDIDLAEADFVVRHGQGDWADVASELLFRDEFVPVCTPEMAHDFTCERDLLSAHLLHSKMRPHSWRDWFKSLGIEDAPKTHGTVLSNAALSIQVAYDGLGVAMVQLAYVRDDLYSGRLVKAANHTLRLRDGYYLVCDPQKANITPIKEFRDWIRSSSDFEA